MPTARALRLCPELRILPSRHHVYSQVSEKVMASLYAITSQVEQISIDEAFIDVSEISEPAQEIARQIQAQIYQELDLPCSIGVASNKLVAKIANDIGKSAASGVGPPMAITVAPSGEEAAFLAPLPVEIMWGVGPKTAERLEQIGILTIGDLAQKPAYELVRLFGKNGIELSLHAQGIDERPIVTFREPKSFSQETTFSRDMHERDSLLKTLQQLSQGVSQRLK